VLLRTWMAAPLLACALACRAPPQGATCRDRASALTLAMRALASSRDGEAPRGILFASEAAGVCPFEQLARRVRCHLARPTVEVASACARGGWTFIIYLPELSDHVHRARVWRRRGAVAVDLASEN
jgi:hypothetical protein